MLYCIHTGSRGVNQINQDEIIYLVYDLARIGQQGYNFFFTDGNGTKMPQTQVFYNLSDLDKIDLVSAYTTNWSGADEIRNPGVQRKKHAEFHIESQVLFNHISEIVVNSDIRRGQVTGLLRQYNMPQNVRVDRTFYFPN